MSNKEFCYSEQWKDNGNTCAYYTTGAASCHHFNKKKIKSWSLLYSVKPPTTIKRLLLVSMIPLKWTFPFPLTNTKP